MKSLGQLRKLLSRSKSPSQPLEAGDTQVEAREQRAHARSFRLALAGLGLAACGIGLLTWGQATSPGKDSCSSRTVTESEPSKQTPLALPFAQALSPTKKTRTVDCSPARSLSYPGVATTLLGVFMTLPYFVRLLPEDSSLSTPLGGAARGSAAAAQASAAEDLLSTQKAIEKLGRSTRLGD